MYIEKCRYFNDSQTACSLMIDDLVPVAVSMDGIVNSNNDWGYLMDKAGGLYDYFNMHIIKKYPELKGTFFMPLNSMNFIPMNTGYIVTKKKVDDEDFLAFLCRISGSFEYEFHGDKHVYYSEEGNIVHECSTSTSQQVDLIVSSVAEFSEKSNIVFSGGKFPGYKYNEQALAIIKKLNAKWWALDVSMINKACKKNDLTFDEKLGIVLIPTNVCGDIFRCYFSPQKSSVKSFVKQIIKWVLPKYSKFDPVIYLNYLYSNQFPIIIQEHFQNQTTNGKRQTPNVYDDIFSLDLIYAFLKGKDVWYAKCGEIAHYFESYIHTEISIPSKNTFSVRYFGIYEAPFLSIKSSAPKIVHIASNKEIMGISKNGCWIFNKISPGTYKTIN